MSELEITGSLSSREKISAGAFWVLAALVLAISLTYNYPFPSYLCSALFAYIPAVCLHELGHAIATVCLGGKVHYITLGRRYNSKNSPRRVSFLGFQWRLYSTAFLGAVHASFYLENFYRSRWCLMILAGPLANFLAATPGFLINFDHPNRFTPLLAMWTIVNVYLGLSSFSPVESRPTDAPSQRDINLIWKILCRTNLEIQQSVRHEIFHRDCLSKSTEITGLTLPELLILQERNPANSVLLYHVFHKMQIDKDPRQVEYLRKLSSDSNLPEQYISQIIDGFLTNQLTLGPSNQSEIIAELSIKLLKLDDCLTTRGTHGSILIDLGRIKEGQEILNDVLIKTTSNVDKTYANIFLALAAKQESNLELARELARKATMLDPNCPALKRVSDLLSPEPENEKTQ